MYHQDSMCLIHWGRVTDICVSKQTNIGSDNGSLPGRYQAIIWTNAGILLIGTLGSNFREISIEIPILLFKKMHLKMSSGKWRPFCLGLNMLNIWERLSWCMQPIITPCGDHFVYAPSHWEMTVQCNVVSHWQRSYTKGSQLIEC